MFFVLYFHVVYEISNFNMWTAKHLAQASCTELTLLFAPLDFKTFLWPCSDDGVAITYLHTLDLTK